MSSAGHLQATPMCANTEAVNSLQAEVNWGNMKMYMHNLSFVDTEMAHNILSLVFRNEDNLISMKISLKLMKGLNW